MVKEEEKPRSAMGFTVERLNALSDGVFAVAITLLVVSIAIPTIRGTVTSSKLAHGLAELWPHFFAYGLSFVIIGMFWVSHHALFSAIRKVDRGLIWLNMLYLLLIVFMPYPTSILALFGQTSVAVILYAAVLGAAALVQALLGFYATHKRRLVDDEFEKREADQYIRHSLETSGVFLLSIVIAVFNSSAAQFFWILLFFVQLADGLIFKKGTRKAKTKEQEVA